MYGTFIVGCVLLISCTHLFSPKKVEIEKYFGILPCMDFVV